MIGTSRRPKLDFGASKPAIEALADLDAAAAEVEVSEVKRDRLGDAKAGDEQEVYEQPVRFACECRPEPINLVVGQRLPLLLRRLCSRWDADTGSWVVADGSFLRGVSEHRTDGREDAPDGGLSKPASGETRQPPLDVLWLDLRQAHPAEVRSSFPLEVAAILGAGVLPEASCRPAAVGVDPLRPVVGEA